jgi:hypothetical protein
MERSAGTASTRYRPSRPPLKGAINATSELTMIKVRVPDLRVFTCLMPISSTKPGCGVDIDGVETSDAGYRGLFCRPLP